MKRCQIYAPLFAVPIIILAQASHGWAQMHRSAPNAANTASPSLNSTVFTYDPKVESGGNIDQIISDAHKSAARSSINRSKLRDQMLADPSNHGHGESAVKLLGSAQKTARATNRKVMVIFYASWCVSCFQLRRFLNDKAIKPIVDRRYVQLYIDIFESNNNGWEDPAAGILYRKCGGDGSIPYYAVVDAEGRLLCNSKFRGQNIGFPSNSSAVDVFCQILRRTTPDLTDSSIATIRRKLSKY